MKMKLINDLYVELSHIATARTSREISLQGQLDNEKTQHEATKIRLNRLTIAHQELKRKMEVSSTNLNQANQTIKMLKR